MNRIKKIIVSLCLFFNSQRTGKYIVNILFCTALLVAFEITDNSILDDVISFFLGFFISNLLFGLVQMMFRSVEDNAKVTDDTEMLVSIYHEDDIEKQIEFNNTSTKFAYKPLYFNDGSALFVEDNADKIFMPDGFISDNYQVLFSAHRMSTKKNFDTVRLDDFKCEHGQARFYLSRSNYYYHMVTNRAVDYRIDDDLSLRTYYEYGPRLHSLAESNMSNHIGINALVYLKDGELLLPRRNGSSTISKNLITSSIAIMLTLPDDNKITSEYLFKGCILQGLVSRTSMKPEWINEEQIDINFLGFGQNPYEGGKPQFYYSVHMKNIDREMYITELCMQKKKASQPDKIQDTFDNTEKTVNESKKASIKKDKIDVDKYIYVANPDEMKFKKSGYLVIPYYHGRIKKGEYTETRGKATVGYEKSFLANMWHEREIKNRPVSLKNLDKQKPMCYNVF